MFTIKRETDPLAPGSTRFVQGVLLLSEELKKKRAIRTPGLEQNLFAFTG